MIKKGGARTICVHLVKASQIWPEKIWRETIVIGKKTRREASGWKPDIWQINDSDRTWQDNTRNGGK